MSQKRTKPARGNGTGSEIVICSPATDTRINTADLPKVQASFLAARYGLDGTRAKLTAELTWSGR